MSPKPKAWIIDPKNQTITPVDHRDYSWRALISEIVGDDVFWLKLDNNAVLWCTDVSIPNQNTAYYFEYMCDPWSTRRYSRGLIVSMGLKIYWDTETIKFCLRWHQRDAWGA
jgi:hypothetical protein